MPHSAKPVREFLSAEDASRYGFDWPSVLHLELPSEFAQQGAHVQVTRVASIERGKKGVFRILNVFTERQQVNLYISPTGLIRVFDGNGIELKRK